MKSMQDSQHETQYLDILIGRSEMLNVFNHRHVKMRGFMESKSVNVLREH